MTELSNRAEQICTTLANVANPKGALAHALARNDDLWLIGELAREEGFGAEADELKALAEALFGKIPKGSL